MRKIFHMLQKVRIWLVGKLCMKHSILKGPEFQGLAYSSAHYSTRLIFALLYKLFKSHKNKLFCAYPWNFWCNLKIQFIVVSINCSIKKILGYEWFGKSVIRMHCPYIRARPTCIAAMYVMLVYHRFTKSLLPSKLYYFCLVYTDIFSSIRFSNF